MKHTSKIFIKPMDPSIGISELTKGEKKQGKTQIFTIPVRRNNNDTAQHIDNLIWI